MTVRLEMKPWKIAIGEDNHSAGYQVTGKISWTDSVTNNSFGINRTRAVVEVYRSMGCMTHRALVGGELQVGSPGSVSVVVHKSSDGIPNVQRTCRSAFQPPLMPGMPAEFAEAAMDGIIRIPLDKPPGILTVNLGGYDFVESSQIAFEFAGGLLMATLAERIHGRGLTPALVETWRDSYR